jgi:hypothetical protein
LKIGSVTTRKKENSGGQLAAVGVKPSPVPCLPAVILAVQTAAGLFFFSFLLTFSFFNKTIETL